MNVQAAINTGLFLQFVYDNWNVPSQTVDLDGRDVVTSVGSPVIPGRNYKVLKTIYSNDLATDLNPARPMLEGYKTMGIIAVNEADATDVWIAIRGTEGIWEWVQDAKFFGRPFPNVLGSGLTEDGFTDMYRSFSLTPGPSSSFMNDVAGILLPNATVTVTGHSLGASLATLFALDMTANTKLAVTLYTRASPRVGDLTFHNLFNHVVPNAYRVANRMDVVTQLPPPLFYFHVGDDTELIPPAAMKFAIPCEHYLSTYLNMLGTMIQQQSLYPIDNDCLNQPPAGPIQTEV
jgi:hypothetical protein